MVEYVFMMIGLMVTFLNVLVFLALRRRIYAAFPKRARPLTAALAVAMLALLHPGLFLMFGGTSGFQSMRTQIPEWGQIAAMTSQLASWIYGAVLLIKGTPGALIGAWRKLKRLSQTEPKLEREAIDLDRRQALAKAGLALPVAIIATAAGGAIAARQTPVVNRIRLPVPRDMTNLHGLTIAQCSDIHVGSYMDAARLDEVRDAMNSTGADIHVVTGDLIDNHPDQLAESMRFLKGLRPRIETFMCVGNHEYIAAREVDFKPILEGLTDSVHHMLVDEARKISIGGDHIWIGGIDYPPQATLARITDRTTRESLDFTLAQMRDDGAPRIVLAHHPRSFVHGRELQLDLMLSGHTHGGQLVAGRLGDFNLSPVLPFEHYHNGYYEHQGRRLYVNSGAGGWMPVRINCPPEITVIELV